MQAFPIGRSRFPAGDRQPEGKFLLTGARFSEKTVRGAKKKEVEMNGRRRRRIAEAASVSTLGIDRIKPSMSAAIPGGAARRRAFDPVTNLD
jgi:hypothetical protein